LDNKGQPSPEEFWARYDAIEVRLSAPLSERMLDVAGVAKGMRVLDVATGRGEPAIRAAHRVGQSGSVLGVDVSASMLQMARERASREGVQNLELRTENAESLEGVPAAHFHVATLRWGLMYMSAPVSALEAIRRALVQGGVLVAALWAEPERVPYHTLPRRLLARYRALPALDVEAPGPFRYASPDAIARDFRRAGFAVEHLEEMEVPVVEAASASALVEWCRALGLSALLREVSEADQQAWESELTAALEHQRDGEVIRLGGVTRIVLARATAGAPPSASLG
jgi:ubiquinone/menaquinone biosynthesis C-methylase UbiE